ncbi:MAG TPA: ABC transporter ATP-binding protein [Candidatus Binatia bacterium]|nr:ABC transporter ATP-binding protein [Candidatus Binatia bacterium]
MLRLEGLQAHYGPSHVLHGVTLEVPAGGVAAIVGRNGVGKTTTLRTVMGLVPATRGRVALDGRDITGWTPHQVARAGVAYVPEGRQVFPALTAEENIRIAERRPARRWPLPRLLELFPALRQRLHHRGRELSGGEQQMLAIARALATDPRLLLLDEPSQGLAPLVVRELARVIRVLAAEGVSVLLVEQNLRLAEVVADRLFVLVKGRVVYDATAEQFRREEPQIRSRYLTL